MNIGIVGGGILGLTSGYYLGKAGHQITVFERNSAAGGLSESFAVADGIYLEKYHHFVSSSDTFLKELLSEIGMEQELCWNSTKLGAYRNKRLHNFTGIPDMLRYRDLSIGDRARFLRSMFLLQMKTDWKGLDTVSAVDWIVRNSGRRVYESVWQNLFEKKFDKHTPEIPAAWLWARTSRRAKNRNIFGSCERFGYFRNSVHAVVKALTDRITSNGGKVLVNSEADKVLVKDNRVQGIACGEDVHAFDAVLLTVPIPVAARIAPGSLEGVSGKIRDLAYAAIVNTVIELKAPFSDYFWLNICDPNVPFPGIIEFSRLRPPSEINGRHFIYLPNYVPGTSPLFSMDDGQLMELYLPYLKAVNPGFSAENIISHRTFRQEHADPYYFLGYSGHIPEFSSKIEGVFLANTSQIYPLTRSINNSIKYASLVAKTIHDLRQEK